MKKTSVLQKLTLHKLTISKLTNLDVISGGSGDCLTKPAAACPKTLSYDNPNCTHPGDGQTDQC